MTAPRDGSPPTSTPLTSASTPAELGPWVPDREALGCTGGQRYGWVTYAPGGGPWPEGTQGVDGTADTVSWAQHRADVVLARGARLGVSAAEGRRAPLSREVLAAMTDAEVDVALEVALEELRPIEEAYHRARADVRRLVDESNHRLEQLAALRRKACGGAR